MLSSDIAGFALIFLGVAIISKLGGAYLGARILAKVEHWPAVLFGSGLTARGSMGIIIATVGLSLQIVSPSMFSVLILMAIGTSLVSPPLIRWSVSHIPIDAEEQARLEREQMGKENPFMQMQRILLPVRFWPNHQPHSAVKRLIVDRLAQRHGIALTIVTVVSEHQREDAKKFLDTLVLDYAAKEISTKVLIGDDSADLILNESQRGYDLLIVGASQKANRPVEVLFTPFVDYIVRLAPCPVLLVKEDMGTEHHDTLSRVLVPTNGSVASRRACQLACSILRSDREESLVFINVVETLLGPRGERMLQRQRGYAGQNIEELTKLAGAEGLSCEGSIRISPEPGVEILSAINGLRADLVVLGISVRAGRDRLFLGPRVERILRDSPVPVLILNS